MVATRHGDTQAEQEEAMHAPATRSRHQADAVSHAQPGQATAAAAGRLTRAAQHQQNIDDSDVDAAGSDDSASEEDGAIDSDGSDACGAAAAAGEDDEYTTGGRSERAGRSLRNTIRKPPPSHIIKTFTRQPTPPRQPSRTKRKQLQRDRERQQRQQEQQLQELQQQQQELQAALCAAAGGSHLTRHQTRLLRGWAEHAPDVNAGMVDAAAGGDADAAELLAAAAAEALVKSEPGSDAEDESEDAAGSFDGDAAGAGSDDEDAAAAAAAGGSRRRQSQTAGRGLKAELLQLKQAAAEAKAAERRRRQREAIRQAARQQRILRDQRLGGSRRNSYDDVVLEYSSDEEGVQEDSTSQDTGTGRGRSGRRLRKRRCTTWSEGSDGDADGDEDEGSGRKKYKLRSRDSRGPAERLINERPAQATRPIKPRAVDQRRGHVKLVRSQRRRGGFSELSSDEPDDNLLAGGRWSRLLAGGPTGPFYAPGGLPPTPAAAAVAAAAGGMLSPRAASLDRRGSAFLDAAPGTVNRVTGSGWGHWGSGGAGEAAASGGAAAAAGGTAAEKRGAGLGQELITPLQVDPSIDFDQIGGLDQYLSALKEMVFLPLLYPEIFDKFGVNPPRGVLFHGPPGTGKTLVARALAAQASRAAGQKVSFYMRKGADLLSKWVGEAEKQLRLLFEEASKHQPAIIFFDEIDGLAPVRTSKQDQVHNSIVSTLLALMDGLDSRGKVVLIGATNRPDALDPALRRPGRFDRELLFPMPDLTARRSILAIHSRHWQPQLPVELLDDLAQRTGGYCGADLRALCAEASLAALRRVYPQIYASDVKLLIDPSAVRVTRQDFVTAMKDLTPAAHRATASHAKALNPVIEPCLAQPLQSALQQVHQLFPPAAACLTAATTAAAGGSSGSINASSSRGLAKMGKAGSSGGSSSSSLVHMARARMLLVGHQGTGQQQLGAAVLAALEGLPVHYIGLTSLLANAAARCVEEALVSAFTEARRSAPAVIYWPQAHLWWAAAGSGLRCALVALLDDLPVDVPLLLLATAELPTVDAPVVAAAVPSSSRRLLTAPGAAAAHAAGSSQQQCKQQRQHEYLEQLGLDPTLAALFPPSGQMSDIQSLVDTCLQQQAGLSYMQQQQAGGGSDVLGWVVLGKPGPDERRRMFKGVFEAAAAPPAHDNDSSREQAPVELPPAPDAAAAAEAQRRACEAAAARVAYEEDQAVLRSLRMVLRGIVQRALTVKRYRLFAEPPMLDDDEGMQALQCLTCPMDLLTMLYKVDHQQYITPASFLADAHLIVKCAEELYGQTDEAAFIPAPQQIPAAAAAQAAVPAAAVGGSAAAAVGAAAASTAGGGSSQGAAAPAPAFEAAQDPMLCSPEGQDPLAAAAAAAAATGGAGEDSDEPVAPVLPAVRVSVCKEISRAMELKDGLEQQVYQLVPPELVQACEAIAAKGGPAQPPAGMVLPQQLMSSRLPSSAAAQRMQADAANKPTRTTARLTGQKLDKRLLHADPEALMRARKQSKARASAQQATAAAAEAEAEAAGVEEGTVSEQQRADQLPGHSQLHQQQQQHDGEAAADVDMVDAGTAAAGRTQQQQQQQLEESPAALQPVTNGVSRKRRASSADAAAADCGGARQVKSARLEDTPTQLGPAVAADGSSLGTEQEAARDQQQHLQAAGQQEHQQQLQQPDRNAMLAPVQPLLSAPLKAAATADVQHAGELLEQVVAVSAGMQLSGLELLHARLSRVVAAHCRQEDRSAVLGQLANVIDGLQGPST